MDDDSPELLKRCSTCREWKALDAFNRLRKAQDGRQYNCRACNSQYHQENKARHNAQIRARSQRVRAELRELVRAFLTSHPCTDCGERDPVVLEFDLLLEIAKCEVVYANCHRRRTYAREQSVRSSWSVADEAR